MNLLPDVTVATSGLSSIKTGFELIKGVRELLNKDKIDKAEFNNQLLVLLNLLLDARSALTDAEDQITLLVKQLENAERVKEVEKSMVFDQSVYWKLTGNGSEREPEPYCPVCWERDSRLSHLSPGATRGVYSCQIDNTSYETAEYNPKPVQMLSRRRRY